MALLDLSQVTQTFVTILESRLPAFADWPIASPITVSASPPDSVAANHAVSFYLYHVNETAHTKAQDWQINADVPLRYKSMGLTLYYIMTPRSNITDLQDRAYADQLTMGLALKTLHELPLINDTTTVDSSGGPVVAMPLVMRGRDNLLRLTMRPTPADDASGYWQAGTLSARLSAYYEVEAVLLEPEQRQTRAGRVFSYGVHTFVRKSPQITSTRNEISFTIPGDSDPRTLELSPAEVAVGDQLLILGDDLIGDSGTAFLLSHRDFVDLIEVNATWTLDTNGSTLTVNVQSMAGAQAILPGVYGAVVKTTDRLRLPDGSYREFERFSNEMVFAIAPRIIAITQPGAEFQIQVQGFEPHLLGAEDIQLFVGSDRLVRNNAGPPPQGTFFTPAAPTVDTDKLLFQLPASISSGSELVVRLLVRGVESAPQWILAP